MNCKNNLSQLLGHILIVARKLANDFGLGKGGFRVVINDGDNAGQKVNHLHVHVIGGTRLDEYC